MKIKLTEQHNLGLSNRDGEIMIGKSVDMCYLIAEAITYHSEETFEGLGSTEHICIPEVVFSSLLSIIP